MQKIDLQRFYNILFIIYYYYKLLLKILNINQIVNYFLISILYY